MTALDGVFDGDYLYFYEHVQTAERAEREADLLVELLGLRPGDRVLDAACGYGRIANRLARRGFDVVGVDLSEELIDAARARVPADGRLPKYIVGDLREFANDGDFDAAICWFTSFGYFDDSTDRAILGRLAGALRPGGVLALEILGAEPLRASVPADRSIAVVAAERDDNAMLDRIRLSADGTRALIHRVIDRDGRLRRTTLSMRAFTPDEIESWLVEAGFATADRWEPTGTDCNLFTKWALIAIARR